MGTDAVCVTCGKKAQLTCGCCESSVCKNCAQFIDEKTFSFLPQVPQEASHTTYCGPCFDAKVAPLLEEYNETMERAKDVFVFFKNQGKETRLIKRSKESFQVEDSLDREETILKLAFLAARLNFNAIVDVDITSEKVRMGTYQTLKWKGAATAAQVNPNTGR